MSNLINKSVKSSSDLASISTMGTMTITDKKLLSEISVKYASPELNKAFNAVLNKSSKTKWICVDESLYATFHDFDISKNEIIDPWHDTYNFHISDDFLFKQKFLNKNKIGILWVSYIWQTILHLSHNQSDISRHELQIQQIQADIVSNYDYMFETDLVDESYFNNDIMVDISDAMFVHPLLHFWLNIRSAPPMGAVVNNIKLDAQSEIIEFDEPIVASRMRAYIKHKLISESKWTLSADEIDITTEHLPQMDLSWIENSFNNFSLGLLQNNLNHTTCEELFDLLKHKHIKKLAACLNPKLIKTLPLKRLNKTLFEFDNEISYNVVIHNWSDEDKSKLWKQFSVQRNEIDGLTLECLYHVSNLSVHDLTTHKGQTDLIESLSTLEPILHYLNQASDCIIAYWCDVAMATTLCANIDWVPQPKLNPPNVPDLLNLLPIELKRFGQEYATLMSSHMYMPAYKKLLRIVGMLFEQYIENRLGLKRQPYDWGLRNLLNDISMVERGERFNPACPCPRVDYICNDPLTIIDVSYTSDSAMQQQLMESKFDRLKRECMENQISMPNVIVLATNTVHEWDGKITKLAHDTKLTIFPCNWELGKLEKLLRQNKGALFQLLTHNQQEEIKASTTLAHAWIGRVKELPAFEIDENKYHKKLFSMWNRELEMNNLNGTGMHKNQSEANFGNFISNLSWTGPFSNEKECEITSWDEQFADLYSRKLVNFIKEGIVDECVSQTPFPIVTFENEMTHVENIQLFTCTCCNIKLENCRPSTIMERIQVSGMTLTSQTYNKQLSNEIRINAACLNKVDNRVDYLIKVPHGLEQIKHNVLVQTITDMSKLLIFETFEATRKLSYSSQQSTSIAHVCRKLQTKFSMQRGLPFGLCDASHCSPYFKRDDLDAICNAIIKDDFFEFNKIYSKTYIPVNFTHKTFDGGALKSEFEKFAPNSLISFIENNTLSVEKTFDKIKENKNLWFVQKYICHAQCKLSTLNSEQRFAEISKRKLGNRHKGNNQPYYARSTEKMETLQKEIEYMGSPIQWSEVTRSKAKEMLISKNIMDDAQKYYQTKGFSTSCPLPLVDAIIDEMLLYPGVMYAIHCMDIAEQVRTAVSTMTGPGTISIRTCELTGMQLHITIKAEPNNFIAQCFLISDKLPIQCTPMGPKTCSLSHDDWTEIPNTNLFISYMFVITDIHLEQYCALPCYLLDNVVTELQLQRVCDITTISNHESQIVKNILSSNAGIWTLQAARVNKSEGSFFLGSRYILLNMLGISHYTNLGEKTSLKPKTSFEHFCVDMLCDQLNKFDKVIENRDIFAVGSKQMLEKLINTDVLDIDWLMELEDHEDVWNVPLFFSNGEALSASMSIYEVFKAYQQTRKELDTRTAKLTVGNKIQEGCFNVQQKRENLKTSCKGNSIEEWGLRGYSQTNWDNNAIVPSLENVSKILNQEKFSRCVDQESTLALSLSIGQLSLPSCCATMISFGSKLLTKQKLIDTQEALKNVNFSESETDMIRSSSRNQKPLYQLPSLSELRDKANAIDVTKTLRLANIKDEMEATKLLHDMGISTDGIQTQKILKDMCQANKNKTTSDSNWFWNDLFGAQTVMSYEEELTYMHKLSRQWNDTDASSVDNASKRLVVEIKKIIKNVDFSCIVPVAMNEDEQIIDVLSKFYNNLTKSKILNDTRLPRLLRVLMITSNLKDQIQAINTPNPLLSTLNDYMKFMHKVNDSSLTNWETIVSDTLQSKLQVETVNLPVLTTLLCTFENIKLRFSSLLDKKNTTSIVDDMKFTVHFLPLATRNIHSPSLEIMNLFLIDTINLKTMLRRFRRSTGITTYQLPKSTRMHKGLSIASSMLMTTLMRQGRHSTKFDRVMMSFYSTHKMTYGRSFKEQLEKPRELPIKDYHADVKTDFVERVCQSLLNRVPEDACANPKSKKGIQKEMSSHLFSSLNGIKNKKQFVMISNDGTRYVEDTQRTWTALIGNLDHSAWGPNHSPMFFAWQFAPRCGILTEPIVTICTMFCAEGSQKDDEIFPEMWHVWLRPDFDEQLLPGHVKPLYEFFKQHNKAARPNDYDMGQGMFHITSSDNAQCVCQIRQYLLKKIAEIFGLSLTVTDQQGSDDRHALWELRPGSTSCFSTKELHEMSKFVRHTGHSEKWFSSPIQTGLEYIIVALDSMISWSMNYKLSPKCANGRVISEMNSHFEHCGREINPLVRETAPICKFQPLGTHFESVTQLTQLCRSGYVMGSSELSIITLFLHKDTRLRKFFQLESSQFLKFAMSESNGRKCSIYNIPLNCGGSVLPLCNDLSLGSIQQIEEQKLEMLQKFNNPVTNILIDMQKAMYMHIRTELPDSSNINDWGAETIPKMQLIRRGIKNKTIMQTIGTMLTESEYLSHSSLNKINMQMSHLIKLDALTQQVTPTSSKLGEMQRIEQMLKQLKKSHAKQTIMSNLRDASRAARSHAIRVDVPEIFPITSDLPFSISDTTKNDLIRKSNILETTSKMTTMDGYWITWLSYVFNKKEFKTYNLPLPCGAGTLYDLSQESRKALSPIKTSFDPCPKTVQLTNVSKEYQLTNTPVKMLLAITCPELLTFKGMSVTKGANFSRDKEVMKKFCQPELNEFKQMYESLKNTDLKEKNIDDFNALAIKTWQKTKHYLIERVELVYPSTSEQASCTQSVNAYVCRAIIRGMKYNLLEHSKFKYLASSDAELYDQLISKNETLRDVLKIACITKRNEYDVIRELLHGEHEEDHENRHIANALSKPTHLSTKHNKLITDELTKHNLYRHLLLGDSSFDKYVFGSKTAVSITFVNKSLNGMVASATCQQTKVYCRIKQESTTWNVINPDNQNIRYCVAEINERVVQHLNDTRLPIMHASLNPKLISAFGEWEVDVNPSNVNFEPTAKQHQTIRMHQISEYVSPVKSVELMKTPKYVLNKNSFTIEMQTETVKNNGSINTINGNVTMESLHESIKQISNKKSSKRMKFLFEVTKPDAIIRKSHIIEYIPQTINVTRYKALTSQLNKSRNIHSTWSERELLMLNSFKASKMNVITLCRTEDSQNISEKESDQLMASTSILFPIRCQRFSSPITTTSRGPFDEEPDFWEEVNALNQKEKYALLSLNILDYTEDLKFIEEWEYDDLDEPFIEQVDVICEEIFESSPVFVFQDILLLDKGSKLRHYKFINNAIIMSSHARIVEYLMSKITACSFFQKLLILHVELTKMCIAGCNFRNTLNTFILSMINSHSEQHLDMEGSKFNKAKNAEVWRCVNDTYGTIVVDKTVGFTILTDVNNICFESRLILIGTLNELFKTVKREVDAVTYDWE